MISGMTIDEPAALVDFDADAMVEAGRSVAGPGLAGFVEFDATDIHPMFVADALVGMYRDEEHMREHFWELQSYRNVDDDERAVFDRTLDAAGEVRYVGTRMEHATMVRIYDGEQGAWVTFGLGAPVWEATEAMLETLDRPGTPDPFDSGDDSVIVEDEASSRVVGFDAVGALSAAREVAGESLLCCLEYFRTEANVRFRRSRFDAGFDDDRVAAMDEIVSFCHLDFGERMLFEREFPPAGEVVGFLDRLDHAVVVRLLTADDGGLLMVVTPDAPVDAVVDAVRERMTADRSPSDSPYPTG